MGWAVDTVQYVRNSTFVENAACFAYDFFCDYCSSTRR